MPLPRRLTGLALAALALATPAPAQRLDELRPLSDVIGAGEAPLSYIGTRCAGLFAATGAQLDDQLDADMRAQVNHMVLLLLATGAAAMEAEGMEPDAAQEAASAEAADIAAAWRARFAANIAQGRPAFAEDPLYLTDRDDCLAVLRGE